VASVVQLAPVQRCLPMAANLGIKPKVAIRAWMIGYATPEMTTGAI
jgi:hypothetical protein